MSFGYRTDDATSPNAPAKAADSSQAHAEFTARMIEEGASPEAAERAAAGHFEFEATRLRPGQLLSGWTAQRWQTVNFVMLGCFLAVLLSVVLTAPAFHPQESPAEGKLWSVVFVATFFPILVLMIVSRFTGVAKTGKELRQGYTTLRWLGTDTTEVRDSRGNVIPRGDKRLSTSARHMHAFIIVGSACAIVSPAIWIVRLAIH